MPDEKTVFVICPIGAEGSPARVASDKLMKYVIKPVVEELGYSVERADTIMETGTITSHIFNRLVAAPLVLADMTGHNPNVFYELAVRHAVRRPVIHLISKGESIPFDVAPQRAVFFELELDAVETAKDTLRQMIEAIEEAGDAEQDSPISDALDRVQLQRAPQSSAKRESEMLAMLSDIRARITNLEVTGSLSQSYRDSSATSVVDQLAVDILALSKLLGNYPLTLSELLGDRLRRIAIAYLELVNAMLSNKVFSDSKQLRRTNPNFTQLERLIDRYGRGRLDDELLLRYAHGRPFVDTE